MFNRFLLATFVMLTGQGILLPEARAGLFGGCDFKTGEEKPEWVVEGYSQEGSYVGLGKADQDDNSSVNEQRKKSLQDAKQNLVQQIEVKVSSYIENDTQVNNNKVSQHLANKVVATSDADLRGLKTLEWDDEENCRIYTLAVVSVESVELVKKEKLHKHRLEEFRALWEEGINPDKNPNPVVRLGYLSDAKFWFDNIDFKLINEDMYKMQTQPRIEQALAGTKALVDKARDTVAVYVDGKNKSVPAGVSARIIRQLSDGGTKKFVQMQDGCDTRNDCISTASEKGFMQLTWLTVDTKIEETNMGALKGTLSVSKTLIDLGSKHALATESDSAQVIGWGGDELNWESAADKVMQGLK